MRCILTAFGFLLLLTIALPASVLANDLERPMTEQTRQRLMKAHACMQKGKIDCARNILSRYVDNSRRPHPYSVILYGNLLLQQNELPEAARVFEQGYDNYPQCRQIVHNLAVIRYDQERFQEAGELFLKSSELSAKKIPDTRYQAAVCFYQADAYRRAYETVRPLLALQQVKKDWGQLAVHCLIHRKDWPRAEATLIRFLRKVPAEHEYWKLLANVRIERKHYKRAASALEIAYRIKTPSEQERRNLSQLYLYVNAPLMAAHALEDSFKSTPPPKVCDQLTQAYLTAGRTESALEMLDLAIQQKNTAKRWLTKGQILYGKRRYEDAEKALKKAAELKEESGLAHFLLGMSLWEQQKWQKSKEWFNRARQFDRYAKRADRAISSIESMMKSEKQSRMTKLEN